MSDERGAPTHRPSDDPTGETWISVDIESSAPSPGVGSLVSIGACLVDDPDEGFYVELRPVEGRRWDAGAERIHGLTREHLAEHGHAPETAMADFAAWIDRVAAGRRPVFVAHNATFDWMFVADYFHRFLGRNPFGVSGLDIKAWYAGRQRLARWADATKAPIRAAAGLDDLPHTHNALDDAREQARIFASLRERGGD